MKRVLTAVVLIPLVLLIVFRAPLWLFALMVAAIVVLALHEYLNIAEAAGIKPFRRLTYVIGLFPIAAFLIQGLLRAFSSGARYAVYPPEYSLFKYLPMLSLIAVIFGIPLVFRKELAVGLASAAGSAFGVIYIATSLSLLIAMRSNPTRSILIIFVLFSVWAGDIAAYYVGRSIGRHKLAPVVSPNKTWEGAVASIAASVLVSFVVFHFTPQINRYFWETAMQRSSGLGLIFSEPHWWQILVLGIVTNVAAQFGDLFESALKRGVGLKDSGALLPGHGGILDRIDALLFAIPVVWCFSQSAGLLYLTAKINP